MPASPGLYRIDWRPIEEGLAALAEALALMEGTGESFHGTELPRLQGEFLLRAVMTRDHAGASP